jgi:hypothetical protein
MKAIQTGNSFRIYDDSLKTHNSLPPQAYLVNFNKDSGFFLTLYSDIEINERVYGVHTAKVNKVFNSFQKFNRNLGVILSGDKGIGKSLFSKMLAQTAISNGIPLIIVNFYVSGIAEYLNSIEQEVMVLFDEFDKVFRKTDDEDPQAEMLTLFDGIAQGKKLFVVTCNKLEGLNDFLVNRPGRFHYHFRFQYPDAAAITEYLQNSLNEAYWGQIEDVISFSNKVSLNYDCLRAIAFELNSGDSFNEVIKDLNIVNVERERFTLILQFDNGEQLKLRDRIVDLFSEEETDFEFEDSATMLDIGYLYFTPADNVFDYNTGRCVIKADNLKFEIESYLKDAEDPQYAALYQKYKGAKPVQLIFHRQQTKDIHYAV